MTHNRNARRFWWLLGAVNLIGITYPLLLIRRAQSVEDNLFAVLLLIFLMFFLVVVDMISIVMAEVIGVINPDGKRSVTHY
jgi:hypothetical protein